MSKANTTKIDWIRKGLHKISESGLKGLIIEKMASELNSSKGGFYWYFKSRDEFIHEIITYWYEQTTLNVVQSSSDIEDPIKRLEKSLMTIKEINHYYSVLPQIRKISSDKIEFREYLYKAEKMRLDFLEKIFLDLNYNKDESKIKANILYSYYIGWQERSSTLNNHHNFEEQFKMIKKYLL